MYASLPVNPSCKGRQFEFSAGMVDPATSSENYYKNILRQSKYIEWVFLKKC